MPNLGSYGIFEAMGYQGKYTEKLKAQELRHQGFSYNEILLQVSISKDTLSRWCRDISLTREQQERLLSNKSLGQRKGSLVAAENKRLARISRTESIYKAAKVEVGDLSKRERFVIGIALYAGEGDKTDGRGGLANSDPRIIKFMMNWFQEFCRIPLPKFRGALWLHEGLDEDKAKEFWSNLTNIPLDKFHKTYIAKNKPDSKKVRKNIHQFGVFSIRFSDSDKQRKIMGWISALLDGKITLVH